MSDDPISRAEVEALLATHRDLGPSYDAAVVDAFADRLERVVAERVADEVDERRHERRHDLAVRRDASFRQFVLAIISLAACVMIGVPLGLENDRDMMVIALGAIVAVNLAHAWQSRSRGPGPGA